MFLIFRFIYPLHFDVKDIHMRMHIIFHDNLTQKTRYTESINFLQGKVTVCALDLSLVRVLNLVCVHTN
jgi:hypothetical protein